MNKNQGIVLLYAVLMVSIVLTVSLSLLNITLKQIILSATNRDSKIAYYAADSALQCAMYWDSFAEIAGSAVYPFGSFDDDTGNFVAPVGTQQIICFSQPPADISFDSSAQKSSLSINFGSQGQAEVTVTKGNDLNGIESGRTLIEVNGYNIADQSSLRRLQRTLTARY